MYASQHKKLKNLKCPTLVTSCILCARSSFFQMGPSMVGVPPPKHKDSQDFTILSPYQKKFKKLFVCTWVNFPNVYFQFITSFAHFSTFPHKFFLGNFEIFVHLLGALYIIMLFCYHFKNSVIVTHIASFVGDDEYW